MDLNLSAKEEMKMQVTKTYSCPIHKEVTSHDPGKCPQCGRKLNLSPKEQMKAEVTKIYTCPMHPDVSLDKDGKCPKCGMALVEKKSQ
jgi:transcription initiation factor IIE alpha subunit